MKSKWRMLHPATMFFLLTVVVIFLSWIFDVYGLSVIHPQTGQLIIVQNLLSPEGIRWLLKNVVTNFTGFAPLGMVIITMFGIGVAQHSGFIAACIRACSKKIQHKKSVISGVIFTGLLSNIVGDAGYIILLPIAATLFYSAGMHPIGGIITAFVSVACGYSANIIISTLDSMLSRTTQEAIVSSGINADTIGPLSNYYFMFAATFFIAIIIYVITIRKLMPALGEFKGVVRFEGYKPISKRERRALIVALIVGAIYMLIVLWATFSSWGMLRGVTGGLVRSPFIVGILFILSLCFGIMGMVYGFISGRYRTDTDVVDGLVQPMQLLGVYLVITFFASQMLACFEYSQLNKCIAIMGANLIAAVELNRISTLVLFVLFVAVINLIMTSATAKWTFMAFIFVPFFAKMGISPDFTQCAFRIGDSATNGITPFLLYMPLVLTYMQQYSESSTYGTLVKYTWRYSVTILLFWTILLVIWYLAGFPLGL
ncbi:AbgT family transporter [Bacteroides sp. 519]|uniref:AbgT family transporter n=1 Tax=Bacteroides sp. 519 TaxID=2302937 RepID=UPI0013D8674E|nr:AbgT family transporter [Bacteroides sp. 519]NDV59638.1 AbgT family transporter [Bacteroides sp. 519]